MRCEYETKNGALGRNRTADTRLFKALLYRLSYQGIKSPEVSLSVSHLDLKRNEEGSGRACFFKVPVPVLVLQRQWNREIPELGLRTHYLPRLEHERRIVHVVVH
jgi:hypothetical protein